MRMCQTHWDALRVAIEDQGLGELIAKDGREAGRRMVKHLREETTLDSFEPLTAAMMAIISNISTIMQDGDVNIGYLFEEGPEDEIELEGGEGRTWPRCPLCYMNIAHELSCKGEGCMLDPVHGYDYMIRCAAEEQLEIWEKLKAGDAG